MNALPVVIVALLIAVYWAVVLWRTRSEPEEWTWPPAATKFPIALRKRQFQLVGAVAIVVAVVVAAYAAIILG